MENYMTIKEVADLVDITTSTVYKWLAEGRMLPPVKLGRTSYWNREEVTAWIEAGFPPVAEWLRGRKKVKPKKAREKT